MKTNFERIFHLIPFFVNAQNNAISQSGNSNDVKDRDNSLNIGAKLPVELASLGDSADDLIDSLD